MIIDLLEFLNVKKYVKSLNPSCLKLEASKGLIT